VALRPHQVSFTFGRNGTEAAPPSSVYSGQIVAFTPHQADFSFGQIGTDATLQACAYSGQIGASTPHQADFFFGQIGTTPRSRRVLTQAKSGPYTASSGLHLQSNQDRRHAPGVRLLRPNRGLTPHQAGFTFGQIGTDATLRACSYSGQIGALHRIKRTSPSATMISDSLGSRALEAVRAVTYPAEGHFEDYAPQGGSIDLTTLRKHIREKKKLGHEGLGEH
jgi:hypothetical protein